MNDVPISLRWSSHGRTEESASIARGGQVKPVGSTTKGPTRQRPRFRLPPKVQIVPGILGHAPSDGPCVVNPNAGEREVKDDFGSGHRSREVISQTHLQFPSTSPPIGIAPNPNPDPLSSPPPPPPIRHSNLVRFVGHLWNGAVPKSFAAVVKTKFTRTISMKMNQGRGGGGGRGWGGGGRGSGSGRWGGGGGGWGGGGGGWGGSGRGWGEELEVTGAA